MGATHSRPDSGGKVVYNDVPVQFSEDVLNHLADNSSAPTPSANRQSSLDSHIRARIKAETDRLRQEEEEIKAVIHRTLEKENVERETPGSAAEQGENSETKNLNGPALVGELEEVRRKIEKFRARKGFVDQVRLRSSSEQVFGCYGVHKSTPLECWQQVNEFRVSVVEMEQKYINSLGH